MKTRKSGWWKKRRQQKQKISARRTASRPDIFRVLAPDRHIESKSTSRLPDGRT